MPLTINLADRVAIVTGGHGGLGQAIVERLTTAGARVIILDQKRPDAGSPTSTRSYQVDVTEEPSVTAAVDHVLTTYGRLDILVNNAGVQGPISPLLEVSLDQWQETLAINLTGTFLCSKAVVPHMVKAGWGRIINISSLQGKEGTALSGPYAVSKAAQITLAKVMGRELATSGVTVNCITPTVVDAGMFHGLRDDRKADLMQRIPMLRFCRPTEVADMVAFVASDACSFTTGAVFDLSGGRASW
jgi:2-dehydro-3-deoxy-L-rhamnonate dehydrogenase (NAD+)